HNARTLRIASVLWLFAAEPVFQCSSCRSYGLRFPWTAASLPLKDIGYIDVTTQPVGTVWTGVYLVFRTSGPARITSAGGPSDATTLPGGVAWLDREAETFRIINRYGLFAVKTTSRHEIVIEGGNDGDHGWSMNSNSSP